MRLRKLLVSSPSRASQGEQRHQQDGSPFPIGRGGQTRWRPAAPIWARVTFGHNYHWIQNTHLVVIGCPLFHGAEALVGADCVNGASLPSTRKGAQ